MNVRELLELAHLDCLGFLDEGEQAAFEAAFRSAPASVKAQVRAEQARWAGGDSMLPNVEPPPGLRDRVLDSVSTAMFEVEAAREHAAIVSGGFAGPTVSKWWRAGSIGLLSACVVFAGAFYVVSRENGRLMLAVQDERVLSTYSSFRGNSASDVAADLLYSDKVVRTVFHSGVSESTARAVCFSMPTWETNRLVVDGLNHAKPNTEYAVVLIDANTNEVKAELGRFAFDGPRKTLEVTKAATGSTIAIVAVNKGSALLGTSLASTELILVAKLG